MMWTQRGRVRAWLVPLVKLRLARDAARLLARQKVVRSNTESALLTPFELDESEVGKRSGQTKKVDRESDSRDGEIEFGRTTKAECRELYIGIHFVRKAGNSSVFDNLGGPSTRLIFSSEKLQLWY